jgi:hypothetical protein
MSEWMKTGSAECRNGVLSGMYSPEATASQGTQVVPPTFVYSSRHMLICTAAVIAERGGSSMGVRLML